MNYWIEKCKHHLNLWYERAKNGCIECDKIYIEFNKYMIDNRVII